MTCQCPPGWKHQPACCEVTGAERDALTCNKCGRLLTPDWVGDPNVGWCSPCNEWQFADGTRG